MMPALQQARRRRIIALAILLAAGALAIAFLVSPWGQSRADRQVERDALFHKVRAEEIEVAPLRDIDQKISLARRQIAGFEDQRLPAEYSGISETLGRLASDNQVQVSGVRYDPAKDTSDGLRRIDLSANVAGTYPAIMRFINGMERSRTFFIINGVSLQEEASSGEVRLQIKFQTYMRSAS